jgi:hypothetical protein
VGRESVNHLPPCRRLGEEAADDGTESQDDADDEEGNGRKPRPTDRYRCSPDDGRREGEVDGGEWLDDRRHGAVRLRRLNAYQAPDAAAMSTNAATTMSGTELDDL